MKKIFFLLMLLVPILMKSQLFQGGFVIGFTGSQIDGDGLGGYHKIGFSADVYSKLKLTDKFGIISGVGYVNKGAMSDIKYDYNIVSLHYVEVPLWAEFDLMKKFSFTLGINTAYLFRGYQKLSSTTLDEKDLNLLRMEYSIYFSINYKFNEKWKLVFANNYSLLPIIKYDNMFHNNVLVYYILYNYQPQALWFNRSLRLSLQYSIDWSTLKK